MFEQPFPEYDLNSTQSRLAVFRWLMNNSAIVRHTHRAMIVRDGALIENREFLERLVIQLAEQLHNTNRKIMEHLTAGERPIEQHPNIDELKDLYKSADKLAWLPKEIKPLPQERPSPLFEKFYREVINRAFTGMIPIDGIHEVIQRADGAQALAWKNPATAGINIKCFCGDITAHAFPNEGDRLSIECRQCGTTIEIPTHGLR